MLRKAVGAGAFVDRFAQDPGQRHLFLCAVVAKREDLAALRTPVALRVAGLDRNRERSLAAPPRLVPDRIRIAVAETGALHGDGSFRW